MNRLPGTASFVFEGVEGGPAAPPGRQGHLRLLRLGLFLCVPRTPPTCCWPSACPRHCPRLLRLSLGAENTEADVDYILKEVPPGGGVSPGAVPVWDRDAQKPTWGAVTGKRNCYAVFR